MSTNVGRPTQPLKSQSTNQALRPCPLPPQRCYLRASVAADIRQTAMREICEWQNSIHDRNCPGPQGTIGTPSRVDEKFFGAKSVITQQDHTCFKLYQPSSSSELYSHKL